MKISQFKQESHLPDSLIDAVIEQFGSKSYFKQCAHELQADGGYPGFTYYSDTVKFAKDNQVNILGVADEMAQEFGQDGGALELIASFNCLNGDLTVSQIAEAIYNDSDDSTYVLNALAWFALEEVARSYSDIKELAA